MSNKRRRTGDIASPHELTRLVGADTQVRGLLHELQVHSEEITVQNEQLLKAQTDLEEARDGYADLFDFSPIGYVALDAAGAIREANIAATAMLEKQRSFLVGLPFVNLINPLSREAFRKFLLHANSNKVQATAEVALHDLRRIVKVVARPIHSRPGKHQLFTALLDITAEHHLKIEKQAAFEREQQKTAELAQEVEIRLVAEERVKALLERLVSVQEKERRRLALNLHDQLGQQLTALRLTVAMARQLTDPQEQAKRFELVDQIVSQLDRDIDFLAWELRPPALDDVGLEAAVQQFLGQWSAASGVRADFHHGPIPSERLQPELESNLYRIIQEALNNVSKHAQAHHVSVILERREDEVKLIVEDDGCGFEIADEVMRLKKGGMGLAGIRERTALVGGDSEFESSPGKGTTLFIRIPVGATAGAKGGKNSHNTSE